MKKLSFFMVCVILGCGIMIQSRVSGEPRLYVAAKTVDEYKASILSVEAETENLKRLEQETRKQVGEFKLMIDDDNKSIASTLKNEVAYYKKNSGRTSVKGPGIVVTIDDGSRELYAGEDANSLLIHDKDLLMVVNELNLAGAEAISLNGSRITATTEIVCSGYTVSIGGSLYARPFTICAIGNARRLERALMGENGYGRLLKEYYELTFEVEIKKEIIIEGAL